MCATRDGAALIHRQTKRGAGFIAQAGDCFRPARDVSFTSLVPFIGGTPAWIWFTDLRPRKWQKRAKLEAPELSVQTGRQKLL